MHLPSTNHFSFPKTERLRGKKLIERLFKEGKSSFLFPFKVIYLSASQPSNPSPQVLVSVSRRNFKKAVDRNLIKRRIREIYRLHKQSLHKADGSFPLSALGIIYVAKEKIPLKQMEEKLTTIFKRLSK